jgi:predicted adenylyl cyclase CyaB
MSFINIEIKARTYNADRIRKYLFDHSAEFKGTDEQTDTYFNVSNGRLKLREGNIERNLIYYNRPNQEGPKLSDFQLFAVDDSNSLRSMLTAAIGVKVVVRKKREIYFIENVKFHLDTLEVLGNFIEIEASNKSHEISVDKLREQCSFYMKELDISDQYLINSSYSDLLI